MKAATRDLLRAVVSLIEDDLIEIRDAIVEIDAKAGEAHHAYSLRDKVMVEHAATVDNLSQTVRDLSQRVRELEGEAAVRAEIDNHSRHV